MLDDLRRSAQNAEFEDFDYDEEERLLALEQEREIVERRRFLGMRPVERMMLSIFFFMNVCVLTLAFLLATGRLVF